MKRFVTLSILAFILLGFGSGCVSRYKMDLFLVQGEQSKKIQVESTEFVRDAVLNAPLERERVLKGGGNCLIVHTGARGESLAKGENELMTWDVHLMYDLLVQMPAKVEPSTIPLVNHSYVTLVGQFDRPAEENVYSAREGELVVDSIPGDFMYATIAGTFVNPVDDSVSFRGQFRVRTSR